ncbi:uncharacterized protein SAMN05216474_0531 [Lishizhenia tianjinensis]|uniref:HD domain-containing protein n=1 Tax=Lishizhenia tianjinensis TaxID=477690 RepID=A0A1I6XYC0_9FLAO|nr:HD domain-containing protein [Lishizhenia tianjinensis]SFT43206.1 uncharacterized protein SAMN05216474_0531 [Lishizhenia tianjinensis]
MELFETYKGLVEEVKKDFLGEGSGHDWSHIERVLHLALKLHKVEGGNQDIIFLAALIHDVGDHKFHDGDYSVGPKLQQRLLEKHAVSSEIIKAVIDITANMSYSKGAPALSTLEGKIVQDADRLDAMGYMGIARCFAYGGNKNRPLYSSTDSGNSLQHFDDKLLELYGLLNTKAAREIGKERHTVMQAFKDGFLNEWNLTLEHAN